MKTGKNCWKTACAWHGITSKGAIYDFVPYQGDKPLDEEGSGCVATGNPSKEPVKKTSKSASHEYAEAATDPELDTWFTLVGEEIADLCSEENDLELPDGAWAQNLYDDHLRKNVRTKI